MSHCPHCPADMTEHVPHVQQLFFREIQQLIDQWWKNPSSKYIFQRKAHCEDCMGFFPVHLYISMCF